MKIDIKNNYTLKNFEDIKVGEVFLNEDNVVLMKIKTMSSSDNFVNLSTGIANKALVNYSFKIPNDYKFEIEL